jgi:cobalt-zinc-cadmium efflux system outer membrane protein
VTAWRMLATVVGVPDLPMQPLLGDPTTISQPLDSDSTLARLLTSSPEIARATFEVTRAQAAIERASFEHKPNLNLQGLVNWQDNGIGGKSDGGVLVSVPVPLWDRNQGAIRRAQQEYAAARRGVEQVELDLRSRLAPIFEQYSNAQNQVERYRTLILPTAGESLELMQKRYRAGESDYVAMLMSQRTYAQTNWNYLESVRSLRIAEAQIEGFLLQGSLENRLLDPNSQPAP